MKTINLFLEEREYESLVERKKNLTWKQFIMQIGKEQKNEQKQPKEEADESQKKSKDSLEEATDGTEKSPVEM